MSSEGGAEVVLMFM